MSRPQSDKPARKRSDRGPAPSSAEQQRQEQLLDEALEETFPASDPIAPARITPATTGRPAKEKRHR